MFTYAFWCPYFSHEVFLIIYHVSKVVIQLLKLHMAKKLC